MPYWREIWSNWSEFPLLNITFFEEINIFEDLLLAMAILQFIKTTTNKQTKTKTTLFGNYSKT